jgi:purine-binding chemotaxis protein CheW
VPGVPDFVAGVTDYRGEVLAIIDLRKFFGIEAKGMTDLSRIVVIGGEKARLGLLVDRAEEVMVLPRESVISQQSHFTGPAGNSLLGVTRGALIVLDGAALLNDDRLVIRQDEETEAIHSGGEDV